MGDKEIEGGETTRDGVVVWSVGCGDDGGAVREEGSSGWGFRGHGDRWPLRSCQCGANVWESLGEPPLETRESRFKLLPFSGAHRHQDLVSHLRGANSIVTKVTGKYSVEGLYFLSAAGHKPP